MSLRFLFLILAGILFAIFPVFSQVKTIAISFDDIPEFAMQNSPALQMIEQKYDLNKLESRADLQWSNPALHYSLEFVEDNLTNQKDEYLYISKQIEMPWVNLLRRQSWNMKNKAYEFEKDHLIRKLLAEFKSRYVEIKLLDSQASRLDHIKEIMEQSSRTASDRLKEGVLSTLEQQMIHLSASSIGARNLKLLQRKREVEFEWRNQLGIDESHQVNLVTPIQLQIVPIDSAQQYLSLIPATPGLQFRLKSQQALHKRIQMERLRFLPEVELFGGYKRVNPDFEGYTWGVTVPLPLFNFNRAQVQEQQVQLNLLKTETDLYQRQARSSVQNLLKNIEQDAKWLRQMSQKFDPESDPLEKLMFSYSEGWISLAELLNFMQIYVDSMEEFYDRFIQYYQNIFNLEALLNKQLITL